MKRVLLGGVGVLFTVGIHHYGDKGLNKFNNMMNSLFGTAKTEEEFSQAVNENTTQLKSEMQNLDPEGLEMANKVLKILKDANDLKLDNKSLSQKLAENSEKAQGAVNKLEENRSTLLELVKAQGSFDDQQVKAVSQADLNKLLSTTNDVIAELQKISKSKILPDISNLTDFMTAYYKFLDSLSICQEAVFLNILVFIMLIIIVFNLSAVFFGNEIIKYFKLEQKYPKLAIFFKIRATFQRYYLFWNIILIFVLCFISILISLFGLVASF